MSNKNPLFQMIEKKTGVNMDKVVKLANSLENANFKDEKTVRGVIQEVAQLANKKVPKQKEDKIVEAIMKNDVPLDFSSLSKMINKK